MHFALNNMHSFLATLIDSLQAIPHLSQIFKTKKSISSLKSGLGLYAFFDMQNAYKPKTRYNMNASLPSTGPSTKKTKGRMFLSSDGTQQPQYILT
jgi:hypothetical protein